MGIVELLLIAVGLSMDAFAAVSYTHLDVYKRQSISSTGRSPRILPFIWNFMRNTSGTMALRIFWPGAGKRIHWRSFPMLPLTSG